MESMFQFTNPALTGLEFGLNEGFNSKENKEVQIQINMSVSVNRNESRNEAEVTLKIELGDNLELGYFEQEVKGENRNSCIEELWQEFPSYTQYQVRSALAKCGLTTKHIESQVRVLSGGEQAKVRLCKLLNRDTNFLLLDEPTNHLDVDAKDSLKQALQEYKGSILLICHEPEFYQDVVDEVWDMSQWTTKVF